MSNSTDNNTSSSDESSRSSADNSRDASKTPPEDYEDDKTSRSESENLIEYEGSTVNVSELPSARKLFILLLILIVILLILIVI